MSDDVEDAILVPSVNQAISRVMQEVQAISKDERNRSQNFNFRGIDAVMNAVGPALRKHEVIVIPEVLDRWEEEYKTTGGTRMRNVVVQVRFTFIGPDGNAITASTFGEAADAGDKAYSKAQSVALRVALLQSLCIPTDEPDPDGESHERAAAFEPAPAAVLDAVKEALGALSPEQAKEVKAWWKAEQLPPHAHLGVEHAAKVLDKIKEYVQ